MTYILGINAYHGDSSACLLENGKIVAAAEEERFRRIKHWAGFPELAIRYCLEEAGAGLESIQHVAINQNAKANLVRKLAYVLLKRPDMGMVLERIRNRRQRDNLPILLSRMFPGSSFKGRIHQVEHHLAHLSSAFLVSPFDEAVVVSVDGFGDFSSGAWGVGHGSAIRVSGRVYYPHSLGIFYQALTQFLGFPNYGDEYKVMGLAPYGRPVYLTEMRRIVRLERGGAYRLELNYFRHHTHKIGYRWENSAPAVGRLYSDSLQEILGPPRKSSDPLEQHHYDLAASVQAMYEEAFFHLLDTLYSKYGCNSIALSGGCAMNSVANGKIRRKTPFRKIYIQPAAGDAGGAIGAAFHVWHKMQPRRTCYMDHAYWGPEFDNLQIERVLRKSVDALERSGCRILFEEKDQDIWRFTAEAIAEGKVAGWFQGRMEWGPRALGNRSILCDPRRPDMKDILNHKIKRRESFRPFAPSILREHVSEWFEEDDDVPFMMKVFQVREEKRSVIPAVTHVDGSGRLQTVYKATNPKYYRLIEAFFRITGVPILLNTSFNENEPVVCRPEEALDCFLRTKMDILVIGNWMIMRG